MIETINVLACDSAYILINLYFTALVTYTVYIFGKGYMLLICMMYSENTNKCSKISISKKRQSIICMMLDEHYITQYKFEKGLSKIGVFSNSMNRYRIFADKCKIPIFK
jgi:hypothetical protein